MESKKGIPSAGATGDDKGLVDFVEHGISAGDEPGSQGRSQMPTASDAAQPSVEKQKENEIFREMGGFANEMMNQFQARMTDAGNEPAKKWLDNATGMFRRKRTSGTGEDEQGPEQGGPPRAKPVGKKRSGRNARTEASEFGCGPWIAPGFGTGQELLPRSDQNSDLR